MSDLLGRYTHEELKAAFERVQNSTNWKNPIDCWLEEDDLDEIDKILFSIEFFTATVGKVVVCGRMIRVTADGYYAGPAN